MAARLDPLIAEVGAALQEYCRAAGAFDDRAGDRLGLNHTDLRCLDLILLSETTSPSRLAAAAGLTTGGVTTVIDRLERVGYVVRSRGGDDRRRIVVRPTERARAAVDELYGPLAEERDLHLSGLDEPTLTTVLSFLTTLTEIKRRHLDRS